MAARFLFTLLLLSGLGLSFVVAGESDVVIIQQGLEGYDGGLVKPDAVHGNMTRICPEKNVDRIELHFQAIDSLIKVRTNHPRVIRAQLKMFYMYEWWTAYRHEVRCEDLGETTLGASVEISGARVKGKKTKTNQWLTWDLPPKLIQRWVNNPETNKGLRLYFEKSDLLDKSRSGEKEVGFIGNASKIIRYRPKLVVTYEAQADIPDSGLKPTSPKWLSDFTGRQVGGETLIRWSAPDKTGVTFDIELSHGKAWKPLASAVAGNQREFEWNIEVQGKCKLRIRSSVKGKVSAWVETSPFLCVPKHVPFRLSALPTVLKIRRDIPLEWKPMKEAKIELAGNEEEGVQLIIYQADRKLKGVSVSVSEMIGRNGKSIKPEMINVWPVGYVKTVSSPQYLSEYEGWHADVLLQKKKFDVDPETVQPVWISFMAKDDISPGVYKGTIKVVAEGGIEKTLPFRITVWDFKLPTNQSFPVLVQGNGNYKAFGYDRKSKEAKDLARHHEDMLFAHRMSPFMAPAKFTWNKALLPQKGDSFDFSEWDKYIERLLAKGTQYFVIASAPKLGKHGFPRKYSEQWKRDMRHYLKAMCAHLKEKGWVDKALFYSIDEAAKHERESCKMLYGMVKEIEPKLKVFISLNDPGAIKELSDYADIINVNLRQYHKAGIPSFQKKGNDAWLYLCCWPSETPNLFTDYSGIDPRVFGWMCWKLGAKGQVYWSTTAWKGMKALGEKKYIDEVLSTWDPISFGKYNGDGTLFYPGKNGTLLRSIRLENYRDGLEDFEYLALLKNAVKSGTFSGNALERATALLAIDDKICDRQFGYETDGKMMLKARREMAKLLCSINP